MSRFFMRDSGGVTRQVKRFFARDSGGTTRTITRAYLRDSSGVARLFYAAGPYFTITAAVLKYNGNPASPSEIGYAAAPFAYIGGTLDSSSGFLNGTKLLQLESANSPNSTGFAVGGLTADPGQSSLDSVTANGVTLFGANATYGYNATDGYAQWSWGSSTFNFVSGTVYLAYAVRNGSAW